MPNHALPEERELVDEVHLVWIRTKPCKNETKEKHDADYPKPPMANLFFVMRARASFHREEPCDRGRFFGHGSIRFASQAYAEIQKTREQVGEEVHDDNEKAKEEG